MKKILLLFLFLIIAYPAFAGPVPPNWKSWPTHARNETRIEASMVAELLTSGEEKIILIYAGYKDVNVICGSIFIPYTSVPPRGSGSRVNFPDVPKDTMMVAY